MDATRTNRRGLPADEAGVAAIEYALIAALIALAMLGGLRQLGTGTADLWDEVATAVASA